MERQQKLARRPEDGMIAGVCAGIGEAYGINPMLVRLAFIGVAVISGGLAVVVYLIAALALPRADDTPGIESVRHGVDDLVARGREMYGETRKVIDRARGATTTQQRSVEPGVRPTDTTYTEF